MQYAVPVLSSEPGTEFPDPRRCRHPDGLVAVGGDLSRTRILNAYRRGIFPWFEPGGPFLWWSPDPRALLFPEHVHVSRRLARSLRQQKLEITVNRDFAAVIDACAAPRSAAGGTWITREMREAYLDLHRQGSAHSVEARYRGELVGGLYGVSIGRIFFAESKFHRQRDASKIALIELMRRLERNGFLFCDCQMWNPHLEQFGIRMVDRDDFLRLLEHGIALPAAGID